MNNREKVILLNKIEKDLIDVLSPNIFYSGRIVKGIKRVLDYYRYDVRSSQNEKDVKE